VVLGALFSQSEGSPSEGGEERKGGTSFRVVKGPGKSSGKSSLPCIIGERGPFTAEEGQILYPGGRAKHTATRIHHFQEEGAVLARSVAVEEKMASSVSVGEERTVSKADKGVRSEKERGIVHRHLTEKKKRQTSAD